MDAAAAAAARQAEVVRSAAAVRAAEQAAAAERQAERARQDQTQKRAEDALRAEATEAEVSRLFAKIENKVRCQAAAGAPFRSQAGPGALTALRSILFFLKKKTALCPQRATLEFFRKVPSNTGDCPR